MELPTDPPLVFFEICNGISIGIPVVSPCAFHGFFTAFPIDLLRFAMECPHGIHNGIILVLCATERSMDSVCDSTWIVYGLSIECYGSAIDPLGNSFRFPKCLPYGFSIESEGTAYGFDRDAL